MKSLEDRVREALKEVLLEEGERINVITVENCGCKNSGGKCGQCTEKRYIMGAVTIRGSE